MPIRRFFALACLLASSVLTLAGARHAPKTYRLIDVRWSLSFDEAKRSINGEVTNTVRPMKDGLASVAFDCAKLEVSSVTVNGAKATFVNEDELLTVRLPRPATQADSLKVRIVYSGRPEAGIYFIPASRAFPAHTSCVYTQGEMIDTRYWLPTYDWPDNRASFESFIKVPKGYYALSNGKLEGIEHEADADVFHWKLPQPQSTYLISLVAGRYDEGQDAGAKVPTYFYAPEGLKDWGEAAFGGTSKIVDFYGRLTGFPYPYAKFSQAAVPDYMFGGMENTTCVTQTLGALFPAKVAPLRDATGLVAHELAHQWFGDTVTCSDWEHIWLNEGFA
ncbi:MAG: hypothetical protein HY248_03660, partial [Fimbriimonas ginsengisoli]|nr:hypothetical protein [Fimbriimonas ginsengisoli]